jgi:hypothetical protein
MRKVLFLLALATLITSISNDERYLYFARGGLVVYGRGFEPLTSCVWQLVFHINLQSQDTLT